MEPTLHCARPAPGCEAAEGDRVFALPYKGSTPRRGDIVVFQTPRAALHECGASGLFIKRVIGLPGDRWRERDGTILIDGKVLLEPWLSPRRRGRQTLRGGTIPAGHYLLLGDNRMMSCDSRIWGSVPLSAFRGRIVEIKRGSKRIHIR
jgi:signal peptidase I